MTAADAGEYVTVNQRHLLSLCLAAALVSTACSDTAKDAAKPPPGSLVSGIQDAIAAADLSADAYYDKTYRAAEAAYWLRIAGWIVEDALEREHIGRAPANTVLDLGCGYGTLLAYATTVYGTPGICFDVIPFVQPDIQARYGITYTKLDIERQPFPESLNADVVLMTEVIEHLNFHPQYTLEKIFAALRPGGSFFVSTPDADAGWGRVYEYYERIEDMGAPDPTAEWIDGHIWQYTESEVRRVLEAAGFVIKRLEHAPGAVGQHFNIWAVKPAR